MQACPQVVTHSARRSTIHGFREEPAFYSCVCAQKAVSVESNATTDYAQLLIGNFHVVAA